MEMARQVSFEAFKAQLWTWFFIQFEHLSDEEVENVSKIFNFQSSYRATHWSHARSSDEGYHIWFLQQFQAEWHNFGQTLRNFWVFRILDDKFQWAFNVC